MNTLTGYSKNILSDLYALTASGGHFSIHNGRNNEADKLVRTDSNGYLNTGWINTTSGSFSGTPSRIYASNDAYIRYMTPAKFFPTLANSDKQLSITVGGQNRKLTIDYATSTLSLASAFSFGGGQQNGKYYYIGYINLKSNWEGFHAVLNFTGVEGAWGGQLYIGFRLSNSTTAFSGVLTKWLSLTDPIFNDSVYGTYEDSVDSDDGAPIRIVRLYIKLPANYKSSGVSVIFQTKSLTLTGGYYSSMTGTQFIQSTGPNADTVDGQHFDYSNVSNSPTYLWATNANGTNFLAARGSISVNKSSVTGDGTINMIPQYQNEINFGGTSAANALYFGYRAVDSKPIPTSFVFGGSDGSASVKASGFIKKGSSDSYVLLGGSGHKLESNLSVNYATSAGSATTASSIGNGALVHMCSLYAQSTYNAYKITTNWHKSWTIMPTINIRGYAYGSSQTIDCDIVMYHFENTTHNYSLTNKGSYPIRVWQAIENDVQVFYINPGEYFGMFNVFVYGGVRTSLLSGWTMDAVDAVAGTEIDKKAIATSITGNSAYSDSSGYASSAGNADTVDNKHALDFLQYITQNATFSSVANISTDLTPGIHKIHISGVEYSSILTGKDFNGSYWQMYFHPTSGYTQDIKYRATNCTTWKTLLDSNNYTDYTVKKDGTGASGTWGINISGTASKATNDIDGNSIKTTYLRKVSVANNTTNDFNTFENMTLTGRGDPTTGASLSNAPWTGSGPAGGYGVLTYLWGGYGTQMAWGYGSNKIYVRYRYYSGGVVWSTTWDQIALISDIPTSLKNPYTLTFSAGAFAAKTYDGSAAVTVNIPTKVSQLTNDSGFVTRNINTSTNTNPFIVSRSGGTVEALKIGVNDNSVYFVHEQDETVSDFIFKGKWNDTESGGGNSAGEKTIRFGLSSSDHNIYVGSSKVLHAGNYTSYLGYIGTTSVQSSSAAQALTGISRINNSTSANIYLGNSGNQGWVMTQDICSHSGSNYWAISVAGNAWFKKVNIGYAYGTNGSNLLNVTGGLIDVTNNGNTLSIGSRNATWCHFENSADIAFYFNNTIHSTGGFTVYSTSYGINSSGVGTFSNVKPVSNNTYTLGTSSLKWKNVYATTFNGNLSGNATTATNADTVDTYHISVNSSAGNDSNTIYFVI